ncbi:MAG: HD domain-containing protein [Actinomycetes bacterium]
MAATDQRHLLGVAKAVERHGVDRQPPERWVMAAALLHDVGKTVSGLGTYGRVVATLSEAVGGASMATAWTESSGFTRKVGLYLQYPALGADLLRLAGSDERVVAWAAEHHLPEEDWTVPLDAGRVLALADDGQL